MPLNNEDIKQLIAILQRGLATDADETVEKDRGDSEENVVKSNNIKTRNAKISSSTNKFLDMQESRMHREDTQIDKQLSKYPPTPRTRKFAKIKVACRVCGRKEEISPSILENPDRYKCNKCATSPG